VETAVGKGTTVRLLLPQAGRERLDAPAESAEAPAPSLPAEGARVLLVEDNEGLARPTAELLRNAGYEVVLASSGDEAIALLRDGRFDSVLSDIRMPGTHDGVALARWARQNRPGLPIVLMTGYSAELAQAETLGVPVLAKPAPAATLLRALGEAIASRAVAAAK
jgi:CheY-like chemotaxis protein